MSEVVIPKTIESIGRYAFYCCSNLKTVVSEISNPFNLPDGIDDYGVSSNPFASINRNVATLYVPKGTKAKYEAAKGWKDCFARIVEGDPTAIESIQAGAKADTAVYSLSGQRLDAPRKGINIINGKKVVIK